ncbi:MAG: helix-turn-helix transcriptional regulator [Bacteroidota bacterium]
MFYLVVGSSSLYLKTQIWHNGTLSIIYQVENILLSVALTFYSHACFQLLKSRKEHWQKEDSGQLLSALFKALLATLTIHLLFELNDQTKLIDEPILSYSNYLSLLFVLLYLSLKTLFEYLPRNNYSVVPLLSNTKNSSMASSINQKWFQNRTEQLFKQEKIYLNPALDLTYLCEAYGVSKRKLSIHTKATFGKNINELINSYRINHVLKCFHEGQHNQYNILSIAYSAGFPSKSTFYRVFKETTGRTPTGYLKLNKKPK